MEFSDICAQQNLSAEQIYIKFSFRYKYLFRAAGKSRVERNISAVSSHHFYDRGSLMRGRSISYFAYRLKYRGDRGIETYSEIRIPEVIVYRSGDPHDLNPAH